MSAKSVRGSTVTEYPHHRIYSKDSLPHRYPWDILSRVEIVEGKGLGTFAEGYFTVFHDIHCQGHFPERPIFPGVLVLEAAGHTVAVLALYLYPEWRGYLPVLEGVDKIRWVRPLYPNDIGVAVFRITETKFDSEDPRIIATGRVYRECSPRRQTVCKIEKLIGRGVSSI